jgi:Membrane-associated phospholipid phosphatase
MRWFISLLMIFSVQVAQAFDDPTDGKPFVPWLWEDQLKPTIQNSFDTTGLAILASGAGATVLAHQYDDTIYRHNKREDHLLMDGDTANFLGWLGNGQVGIGIAIGQLFLDQENGIKHGRALILTSVSHITLATAVHRERPNGANDLSFPSGHASSAFTTAGSLAYAYGWKVGLPAYLAATTISLSRVNENVHWMSDVVAGAAIGIYWAHASFQTDVKHSENEARWMPIPFDDGLMISYSLSF